MRFIFWMPQWLHSFFGVSKVSFATHFWGSLAGYAIPIFVVSLYGQRLFDALKDVPESAWVGMGVAVVLIALGWWGWRVRRVPSRAGASSDR